MWERFSYYGMRALLILYMTKYLLLSVPAGDVAGLAPLGAVLEALFGPLDTQPLASQIYGLYTGLVYLTPIFGGLLADRVLGQRRTVILGAVLMAIGHFMMAVDRLFLVALLALILGSGAFKPNISTQVGGLYPPGDPRRDRAYSIFYVGINVGAFLAPLVCGTLGEQAGWHYGFAAAGVGMLIGLAIYLCARPLLPPDAPDKATGGTGAGGGRQADRSPWRAVIAVLVLFLPNTLFWAAYEQGGNTIVLWADAATDRTVSLFGLSGQIPTTWFLAFNPFMIFAFTPFIVALWARQAARRTEPSTVSKMALGCVGAAASYVLMATAAWHARGGAASWWWLFGYYVVITVGELYLSPAGLSFAAKIAPAPLRSMIMGVWLATNFVGGLLAGWLGSFWSRMDKPEFFLMIAGVAALAALMIAACRRPLARVLPV